MLSAKSIFFLAGKRHCFVEVVGNGPPIVCIHGGFGFDHSYFRPAFDPLARYHQLILLDLPGNGQSDPLAENQFSITTCVAAIEALRVHLRITTWAVLGHSGGGLVAATYAAQHTANTSHLILIGSFPSYPFEAPELFTKARELNDPIINEGLQMFLNGLTTDEDYRTACRKYAPMFFADPRAADLRPFEKIRYRVAPYNETVRANLPYDAGILMRDFHQPTLIIHGTQDYRVPICEAQRWLEYLPHAQFEPIANAGHFPFLEENHLVNEMVGAICQQKITVDKK